MEIDILNMIHRFKRTSPIAVICGALHALGRWNDAGADSPVVAGEYLEIVITKA